MKQVRVADLQDQIGMSGPRPLLVCLWCHAERSAHAGDYPFVADWYIFTCCDEPMQLAIKHTKYSYL